MSKDKMSVKETGIKNKGQIWCKVCDKFISYQSFRGLSLFEKHIKSVHYDDWVSSIRIFTNGINTKSGIFTTNPELLKGETE